MYGRIKRLTLGDKLLLTLASLLVLEAGVRGVLDWTRAADTGHEQFMRTGRDHIRNVAYSARAAFAKGNHGELAACAELLRTPEDSDLVYVAFYGTDGRLLASKTWPEGTVAVPARIAPVQEPMVQAGHTPDLAGHDHYTFLFPVMLPHISKDGRNPATGPTESGTVASVRSYHAVNAKVAEEQVGRLLVTAAMLALCLNVLLVFGRRLSAPIQALVKGTRRIAAGDYSTPVEVGPRRDELRTLADSFNHMANQVARQREQILAHNRELERKVAERTSELVEASNRIRQAQAELVQSEKMRMLGQLAAGIAHEINTPTGAILNCALDTQDHLKQIVEAAAGITDLPPETQRWLMDLVPKVLESRLQPSDAAMRTRRHELERRLRQQGHPEYRRLASVILKCGLDDVEAQPHLLEHLSHEGALTLLERLVAMSNAAGITLLSAEKIARIVRALRLYTRGAEAELLEMDVNETLDSTLAILENRVKHTALVRTDYAEDLPLVRCGADVSQVWTNLINNACDAIEETHKDQMGWIAIATSFEGGHVRVTVANSGHPIPEELLGRLFDPFFTTKPIGKGTGLGLGICKAVLRRCGGTIEARNEADGVTFEVTLPAATPVAAGEPVAAGAAEHG